MEKSSQHIEAPVPEAIVSLTSHRPKVALVLVIVGAMLYGLLYWSCPKAAGCRVYALWTTAGYLCAAVIATELNGWLKRYTVPTQAKTLRFWSRILTAAYLIILPYITVAVNRTSIGNMRGYQIFFEFTRKYIYDPRTLIIILNLLAPYAFPFWSYR